MEKPWKTYWMSTPFIFTQSTKHSSGTLQWGEGYNCPPRTSAHKCLKVEIFPLMPVQSIYIDSLYPSNPAKAGLLVGDRLVAFNGITIDRMGLLNSEELRMQDSVVFDIVRANEEKRIVDIPPKRLL